MVSTIPRHNFVQVVTPNGTKTAGHMQVLLPNCLHASLITHTISVLEKSGRLVHYGGMQSLDWTNSWTVVLVSRRNRSKTKKFNTIGVYQSGHTLVYLFV